MTHRESTHQSFGLRLILAFSLIVVFILAVSILGQQNQPSRIPPTETMSPSPTASRTPSPTATRTPTATLPPPTSTLADINPQKLFTLGQGTFSTLARSPDGRLIATFADGTLKWFDAGTFEQLGEMFSDFYFGDIAAFSPDSHLLALESLVFSSGVIDLQEPGDPQWICGGNYGCSGLVFSPDGGYIAYRSNNSTTRETYQDIGVWDVAGQVQVLDTLPTQADSRRHNMSYPAISPDSRLVAAGHGDGQVYVWNIKDGETRFILGGHAGEVTSVDFSLDGRYLASGSEDGTVRLWSPSSGQLLRVITGLLDDVTGVEFSADSRQLRIGVSRQAPQVYDLNSNQLSAWVKPAPATDPFATFLYEQGYIDFGWDTQLAFSPDSSQLAVGCGNLLVWDVASQELVTTLDVPNEVVYMAYSPDGTRLGVVNTTGEVLVWDTSSWTRALYLTTDASNPGQVIAMSGAATGHGIGSGVVGEQGFAFSPDGARLAVGFGSQVEIWEISQAVRLLASPAVDLPADVARLAYSADGQRIYAALDNDEAAIWDASNGALVASVDLPATQPDVSTHITDLHGSWLMRINNGAGGDWVDIWDLETGELIQVDTVGRLYGHPRFSQDGSLLFAVGEEQLLVWMRDSGDLIYRSPAHFGYGNLAISPDNTRLAVGEYGKAEVWDTSGIAGRAQGSYIPTVVPRPTETPWSVGWSTSTPVPHIPVTPQPVPDLPDGAISPANAAQVTEIGCFGAGRIEQVRWAGNSQFVLAGSQGVDIYTLQAYGALSGEPLHQATGFWVTSSVSLADGRVLATGTDGARVQVLDLSSGERLIELYGSQPVLSPDGRLLAYYGEYQRLRTWDLVAGQAGANLLHYTQQPVFSPDGKLVAAVVGYYSGQTVRVWDAATGVIVNALGGPGPDADITDLSFSPDGRRIVAAAGGSAWVWDVRPGQPVSETQLYSEFDGFLTDYTHTVTAAALSPNGWTLAVGTSENTIGLYALGSQSPPRLLSGHSAAIEQLAFSPNGRLLLARDADGAVLLWNVSTGELVDAIYSFYGEVKGLVFQENGKLTGWQAGTAWTFDPAAGEMLHTTQIYSGTILAVSPLGDLLAATSPYRVSLWDAQSGELRQTLEGELPIPYIPYQLEDKISQGYLGATFSRDGTRLVAVGTGGANVYDTRDGTRLLDIPAQVVYEAELSLDNQWLLMAPYDFWDYFGIFDLHSGSPVFYFPGLPVTYSAYKFSPDNRWVGVVARENQRDQFQLWDFASHTLLQSMDFGEEIALHSLAFSQDARLAALGQADGQILLVDLSTLQVVTTLTGHRGAVERLAFSPDGRYLASGGGDGTIRVWGIP